MTKETAIAAKAAIRAKNHKRSEAMGRESMWRLLFRFSGPSIVTQVVSASYNMIDSIFIGRLGANALAAVSVANPIMMIFTSIGMGTGMGAASVISRFLGAGKPEEANRVAATAMTLFFVVSAALTAVCLPILPAILRLFGAEDPQVLDYAVQYMLIEISFTAINFFSLVLAELVRAEGNPMLSSGGMIVSGLVNCLFDPILGFGWGPFPKLGMAGFALATSVGRGVCITMYLVYLFRGKTSYEFKLGYFWPRWTHVIEIYRVGIASMFRMMAGSIAMAIANVTALTYGVVPLAVRGILFKASSLAFMPIMGLGQGLLPVLGYNFGAKKPHRVGEALVKALALGLAWGTFCWILVMFFATPILSIFTSDPEFLAIGSTAFRIFSAIFFLVGLQMMLSFFFQATGRGMASMITAIARQLLFLIPGLIILPNIFGLIGVWLAYPVSDVLAIIVTLIWAWKEFKRLHIPLSLSYVFNEAEADDAVPVMADPPEDR